MDYLIAQKKGNDRIIIFDVEDKTDTLETAAKKLAEHPGCRIYLGTEDVTPEPSPFGRDPKLYTLSKEDVKKLEKQESAPKKPSTAALAAAALKNLKGS